MMNQVLEYADIFYQKRFLAEKELRIAYFLEEHNEKQFKEMIELDAEVLE